MSVAEENNQVRLGSGQLAILSEGVVQVVAPKAVGPHHFRLTTEHRHTTGGLIASASDYDSLVGFLKQLERLDYMMIKLERQTGLAPRLGS